MENAPPGWVDLGSLPSLEAPASFREGLALRRWAEASTVPAASSPRSGTAVGDLVVSWEVGTSQEAGLKPRLPTNLGKDLSP